MTKALKHRSYVGPASAFDQVGQAQFALLTNCGLRPHHYLLDVGCGCLRAGRLFIPYLDAGHYFGVEPATWLVSAGLKHELGRDLEEEKRPSFSAAANFAFYVFDRQFDYLLAHSIFTHACPEQIDECLAAAARVMKPGAHFYASYKRGQENDHDGEWRYPAVTHYTFRFMQERAELAGLKYQELKHQHPRGHIWARYMK